MRLSLAAMAAILLAAPAAADERDALMARLRALEQTDHVGAGAAAVYLACAEAAARTMASRSEPNVSDRDWAPKNVRGVEQEAAMALSWCSGTVEANAAGNLPAPEFEAIRASALAIAADIIRERKERATLRRE